MSVLFYFLVFGGVFFRCIYFYVYECLSACIYVCHMCAVPIGARRGHWVTRTVVHPMCVWYQTQVLIKSRK